MAERMPGEGRVTDSERCKIYMQIAAQQAGLSGTCLQPGGILLRPEEHDIALGGALSLHPLKHRLAIVEHLWQPAVEDSALFCGWLQLQLQVMLTIVGLTCALGYSCKGAYGSSLPCQPSPGTNCALYICCSHISVQLLHSHDGLIQLAACWPLYSPVLLLLCRSPDYPSPGQACTMSEFEISLNTFIAQGCQHKPAAHF